MKIHVKNYSDIISLVISIILLILGAIMFTRPNVITLFISYVIGGILILIGLFKCIKNYLDIKKDNTISSKEMITGLFLIIIGLVFIFLANVIEALVRVIIGGWILFTGINRLINALKLNKKTKRFIIFLILSIMIIGIGLYTILEANLAFKTIGLVLIIYSLIEINGYIINRQDISLTEKIIKEQEENVIETVLIEEKITKKKKNKKSLS